MKLRRANSDGSSAGDWESADGRFAFRRPVWDDDKGMGRIWMIDIGLDSDLHGQGGDDQQLLIDNGLLFVKFETRKAAVAAVEAALQ